MPHGKMLRSPNRRCHLNQRRCDRCRLGSKPIKPASVRTTASFVMPLITIIMTIWKIIVFLRVIMVEWRIITDAIYLTSSYISADEKCYFK